jgi:hypothetical protein
MVSLPAKAAEQKVRTQSVRAETNARDIIVGRAYGSSKASKEFVQVEKMHGVQQST